MAAGDTGKASCERDCQQQNEWVLHPSVYTWHRSLMSRLSGEIEHAFRTGALILTANPRTARWLRREYALRMRSGGGQAWTTPPIEDWDTWVDRLWQSAGLLEDDPPLALTDLQERQVWLRMQRDDANLLVSPEGMAQLASGAYSLLCSYEAHAERNHAWAHTDAERFQQWAAAFDRECQRRRWLSRGQLEARVAAALDDGELAIPAEILLVGFDRLTPAQQTLLAAVGARKTTVVMLREELARPQMQLLRANDLRDEITVCAWWARRLLENARDDLRIGIVVPDVGSVRGEMERIFRRVLMPETDSIFAPVSAMPFEFSLGQSLATVPVVRAALLLLRWAAAPLREEEVSWLLLSGFITGTDAEMLAAARFDASLRESRSLSMEISLPSLRRQLQSSRWPMLNDLHLRLLQIKKIVDTRNFGQEEREPSDWVDLAHLLLKQAGWPGGRKADTAQFQAIAKWDRALDEVALLDFDGRFVGFKDFLQVLTSHTEQTIFAVESLGAPVQIMGALEASGQRFDALWFLGADDASWPLRGNIHPLLPYDVQKKTRMPHATPEADFELSRTVTESLAASAPVVIVSHAARNKDGELRPSPLIAIVAPDRTWESSQDLRANLAIAEEEHTPAEIEEIHDVSGEIPWPSEKSAGGAEVLRDQAACPFRAFAAKRLGAQELNRSDWGLTAAERGDLLHKVLQAIWSPEFGQLHTLDDLLNAKREGRVRQIVGDAIAAIFAKELAPEADDSWQRAYLDSERRRLSKRILEWLDLEATRVAFEVIACEEELKDVSVGGLKLRLRADRIDQVSDFARLLLDYKTGQVSPADWKAPRPNDPQLPLYAAFGNVEDVCGVLFARIRAGETCMSGMVKDAKTQLFADIKGSSSLARYPYSDGVRDEWTEALLNLAQDFLRGEAAVDPKDGRKTCEYCPLPGLCRVAERPAALEVDDAEAGDV
jgi:ATP-dependent helicase/nuclease subunit B